MTRLVSDGLLDQACRSDCLMAALPDRDGIVVSMLRAGAAMPSAVLRDFSTDPATWHWFQVWLAENFAATDDFRFEIILDKKFANANYTIFGSTSSGSLIRFYAVSGVGGAITCSVFNNASIPVWTTITEPASGLVKVRFTAIGDVRSSYLNDTLVDTRSNVARLSTFTNTVPISQFPGGIVGLSFDNLTAGKSWSYPTWYELKRLLTKYNVRMDRGVFEASNTGLGWSLKMPVLGTVGTVLELRDDGWYVNTGSYSATTGIYTAPAARKLRMLLIFSRTLPASEIAGITQFWRA